MIPDREQTFFRWKQTLTTKMIDAGPVDYDGPDAAMFINFGRRVNTGMVYGPIRARIQRGWIYNTMMP